MKILVNGDKIYGGKSAYSKVGYELCLRFLNMGHKVAHTPMGRANKMGKQMMDGILIQESGDDPFNEDVILGNYTDFQSDLMITLKDVWVFQHIQTLAVNWCPLVPVDHQPISDSIVNKLHYAFKPITISRFGQAELRKRKIESTYIPHGVRTDIFTPLSPEEKAQARMIFGLPKDSWVVGLVMMNRARKGILRQMRGIRRFRELNPNVPLHIMLWSPLTPHRRNEDLNLGVADVGVNMVPEIFALGLHDITHFPDWRDVEKLGGGLPDIDPNGGKDMRKLLGSLDVNMNCSCGEGAGLTYLEAASVEVPSIGTNYAGAPEYVGCGLTVPWHDYIVINTPGVRYALPDIDGMAEALRKIYDGDKAKMAKKLRWHADSYDYDLIMDSYWKPFLEDCSRELYPLVTKEGCKSWA